MTFFVLFAISKTCSGSVFSIVIFCVTELNLNNVFMDLDFVSARDQVRKNDRELSKVTRDLDRDRAANEREQKKLVVTKCNIFIWQILENFLCRNWKSKRLSRPTTNR